MSGRGRPASAPRRALRDRARQGGFTMREVIAEFGLSLRQADWLLRDMRAAGEVSVVGTARVPGAKRPVAVYGAGQARADAGPWAVRWFTR